MFDPQALLLIIKNSKLRRIHSSKKCKINIRRHYQSQAEKIKPAGMQLSQ